MSDRQRSQPYGVWQAYDRSSAHGEKKLADARVLRRQDHAPGAGELGSQRERQDVGFHLRKDANVHDGSRYAKDVKWSFGPPIGRRLSGSANAAGSLVKPEHSRWSDDHLPKPLSISSTKLDDA